MWQEDEAMNVLMMLKNASPFSYFFIMEYKFLRNILKLMADGDVRL